MPEPFNLHAFLRGVSKARGKPIVLLPFPLPAAAPSGVCVSRDNADYIVVDAAASKPQQVHIALHEVSHILLGHKLDVVDTLDELFAHLNMAALNGRQVYARTTYSNVEELEAETLASLLGQRAGLWQSTPPTPPSEDPVIRRMSAAFEHGSDDR